MKELGVIKAEPTKENGLIPIELGDGSLVYAHWLPNSEPLVGLAVEVEKSADGSLLAVAKNSHTFNDLLRRSGLQKYAQRASWDVGYAEGEVWNRPIKELGSKELDAVLVYNVGQDIVVISSDSTDYDYIFNKRFIGTFYSTKSVDIRSKSWFLNCTYLYDNLVNSYINNYQLLSQSKTVTVVDELTAYSYVEPISEVGEFIVYYNSGSKKIYSNGEEVGTESLGISWGPQDEVYLKKFIRPFFWQILYDENTKTGVSPKTIIDWYENFNNRPLIDYTINIKKAPNNEALIKAVFSTKGSQSPNQEYVAAGPITTSGLTVTSTIDFFFETSQYQKLIEDSVFLSYPSGTDSLPNPPMSFNIQLPYVYENYLSLVGTSYLEGSKRVYYSPVSFFGFDGGLKDEATYYEQIAPKFEAELSQLYNHKIYAVFYRNGKYFKYKGKITTFNKSENTNYSSWMDWGLSNHDYSYRGVWVDTLTIVLDSESEVVLDFDYLCHASGKDVIYSDTNSVWQLLTESPSYSAVNTFTRYLLKPHLMLELFGNLFMIDYETIIKVQKLPQNPSGLTTIMGEVYKITDGEGAIEIIKQPDIYKSVFDFSGLEGKQLYPICMGINYE